jgi:hypothetical protein
MGRGLGASYGGRTGAVKHFLVRRQLVRSERHLGPYNMVTRLGLADWLAAECRVHDG